METSKFVFESLNRTNHPQFHGLFTYPSNTWNTTNNRNINLFIPHARTKHYGLNSINNIGACTWNDIPLSIRLLKSKKMYITALKTFHLSLLILLLLGFDCLID